MKIVELPIIGLFRLYLENLDKLSSEERKFIIKTLNRISTPTMIQLEKPISQAEMNKLKDMLSNTNSIIINKEAI